MLELSKQFAIIRTRIPNFSGSSRGEKWKRFVPREFDKIIFRIFGTAATCALHGKRRALRTAIISTGGAWKRKESGKNGAFVAPGEDWKPFRNRGLDHFLHDCAGN